MKRDSRRGHRRRAPDRQGERRDGVARVSFGGGRPGRHAAEAVRRATRHARDYRAAQTVRGARMKTPDRRAAEAVRGARKERTYFIGGCACVKRDPRSGGRRPAPGRQGERGFGVRRVSLGGGRPGRRAAEAVRRATGRARDHRAVKAVRGARRKTPDRRAAEAVRGARRRRAYFFGPGGLFARTSRFEKAAETAAYVRGGQSGEYGLAHRARCDFAAAASGPR